MVGQEKGVEITWHALLGVDPRPVLRLTLSPQPNQTSPKCALSYLHETSVRRLDNTLVRLAHHSGSECALSQTGEVLNHVSSRPAHLSAATAPNN